MYFETKRLVIRQPSSEDFPSYLAMVQDPQTMWWGAVGSQKVQPLSQALATFKHIYLQPGSGVLAVALKTNNRVIGILGMEQSGWLNTVEIGYTFSSKYWHQGYATEAAAGEMAYLFNHENAPYVYTRICMGNEASASVSRRLGLQYEGASMNAFKLHGELAAEWRYGLTAAQYQQAKPQLPAYVRLIPYLALCQSLQSNQPLTKVATNAMVHFATAIIKTADALFAGKPAFDVLKRKGLSDDLETLKADPAQLDAPTIVALMMLMLHQNQVKGGYLLSSLQNGRVAAWLLRLAALTQSAQ